ncbi:MAG TPA: LCP family protein [Patescibacteria group bacterium]|nr:LCP family protein [Patescibacteria group bacterium]
MDNLRRKKLEAPRNKAIDGFIPSSRSGLEGITRPNETFSSSSKRLGDFKRSDGFHGSGPIEGTQATPSPKKRKHFGRQPLRDREGNIALGEKRRTKKIFRKPTHPWKMALKSLAIIFVMIILTGGFLFGRAYWKGRHIFKGGGSAPALADNIDPTKLRGEGDGRVNILILGKGGPGHEGPDLTDTILIASIDPIQKETAILSIPRDLYVKTTNYGSMKINSVYPTAKYQVLNGPKTPDQAKRAEDVGLAAVQESIKDAIGIPIHYYAMVDFEAFRKAIDTVGGITIDVKQPLYDANVAWENHNNPLIAGVGLQTFNGKRALLYARSRYGSARGDFDRTERQREVLIALKDKVLSAGTFGNPLKINQLITAFGDHISTNLSVNELLRVYAIGKDIPSNKISSLGLADPPNDYVKTGNINGLSVVIPRAGLYNYTEIHNYVRNVLKDGYIKSENASILILNGTGTGGLATKKSEELKSYGYNVIGVADAPTKNYPRTILVDLRSGSKKYTRHYLEQRLGVSSVNSLPDSSIAAGSADFVIILGQNEAANY